MSCDEVSNLHTTYSAPLNSNHLGPAHPYHIISDLISEITSGFIVTSVLHIEPLLRINRDHVL